MISSDRKHWELHKERKPAIHFLQNREEISGWQSRNFSCSMWNLIHNLSQTLQPLKGGSLSNNHTGLPMEAAWSHITQQHSYHTTYPFCDAPTGRAFHARIQDFDPAQIQPTLRGRIPKFTPKPHHVSYHQAGLAKQGSRIVVRKLRVQVLESGVLPCCKRMSPNVNQRP